MTRLRAWWQKHGDDIAANAAITAAALLFVSGLYIALAVMLWPVGAVNCRLETTDFEHRYLVIPGKCQVKVRGEWINWDAYRGNKGDGGVDAR